MSIYRLDTGEVIADPMGMGRFPDRAFVFRLTVLGWLIGRPDDPEAPGRWTSFTNQPYRLARHAAGRLLTAEQIHKVSALADPMQLALADEATWKFQEIVHQRSSPAAPKFSFRYRRDVPPPPLNLGTVFLWCESQFGRPRKRWEFAPAPSPEGDIFHFRDADMAFAFKMRWC